MKSYIAPTIEIVILYHEAILTTDSTGHHEPEETLSKEYSFSFDDEGDTFANPKDLWEDEDEEDW